MLPLLAQANGPDGELLAILAVLFFVALGVYLVTLVVTVFFLFTLSKALHRCHPSNRTMEPGMVWLNLIPLFGMVWMFVTYLRLSESLKNEFRDRGWHRRDEDYGQMLGVTASALVMGSGALGYCGLPFVIAGFVCWILYWVKIADFSRQLAEPYSGHRDRHEREPDDHDESDERPRPSRGDFENRDDRRPWER